MGFRWRPVARTAGLVLALVLVLVRVVLVLVLEASKASKAWKASKACGKPQKPFPDFYGETYGKPCRITIGMPCRHVIVCMAQGMPRHRLAVSSFEYGDSRGLTCVASSAIQRGPRYPNARSSTVQTQALVFVNALERQPPAGAPATLVFLNALARQPRVRALRLAALLRIGAVSWRLGVHLSPQQLVGQGGCRHLEVVNGASARPQLPTARRPGLSRRSWPCWLLRSAASSWRIRPARPQDLA